MKCSNCRKINKAKSKFCIKCGQELKQKKVNKIIGYLILGSVVFVLGFWILDFATSKFREYKYKKAYEYLVPTSSELIQNDFDNGLIDEDEYVTQMIYSNFSFENLNEKYESKLTEDKGEIYNHIVDKVLNNIDVDKLSDDTKKLIGELVFLKGMVLSTEEKISSSDIPFVEKIHAKVPAQVLLGSAVLSENENFIVYYNKKGKNKITDKTAENIASMLETSLFEIEKFTGIEYNYDRYEFNNYNITLPLMEETGKLGEKAVLFANGIDTKHSKTAMPVYIYRPFSITEQLSGEKRTTAAWYLGSFDSFPGLSGLAKEQLAKVIMGLVAEGSTYISLPYINIVPEYTDDIDDLSVIVTHELFHHFQKYYCGDGEYGFCSASNFSTEATANLISATTNKQNKSTNTIINGHADIYMKEINKDLRTSGYLGYTAFTFAENYSKTYKDGLKILLDSMKEENDFKYIYENSFDNLNKVTERQVVRNLTNDYPTNIFKSSIIPNINNTLKGTSSKIEKEIAPMSMSYYYVDIEKNNKKIFLETMEKYNNLSYFILGSTNKDKYESIKYENLGKQQIEINTSDYSQYEKLIIGITNRNMDSSEKYFYTISHMSEELTDVVGTALSTRYNDCVMIDFDGIFKTIKDISKYGLEIINEINKSRDESDFDRNLSDYVSEYAPSLTEMNRQATEAENMMFKKLKICSIPVTNDKSFNQLKDEARSLLRGVKINIYSSKDEYDEKVSFGAGIDILTRKTEFYALSTNGETKTLYLMELIE